MLIGKKLASEAVFLLCLKQTKWTMFSEQATLLHLRLHSFLRDVIEDSEETLILPSCNVSVGLACFRKRLYSSVCKGVSLYNRGIRVPFSI